MTGDRFPGEVTVRALRPEDWPAVRQIYAEGIATGNATFETEVPTRAALEAKWLPGHRWVAELDGQVAGWASAAPVSVRDCYAGVAETSVYVGAGWRGRGVGKALLHKQVTAADAGGLWTLQTGIFPENRASLALHHAAGFRTVGVRERIARHHGRWRDTVLLERRRDGDLSIVVDDLSGPEIAAFLDEHVQQMRSITPPESKHALDLDGLRAPEVTFWSVLDGDSLVGCGAIKRLDAGHAEVKSMRTTQIRKRTGIASLLLAHIIAEATRMGFTRLSLETGTDEFFRPARTLYEKFGFGYCEPFANYRPDPLSAFMTKTLAVP
jgi:L-amino acid N-acyltransferase YncA